MMNILRSKQKAILWFLVIIITPAFVIWGVGSMGNSSSGGNTIAMVNGEPISVQEFYQQFSQRYEQTLKMYESYFGALDKNQKENIYNSVALETAETVINQRILADYAKKIGIVVTVDEIREDLKRQLSMYGDMLTDGKFDDKKFTKWIADMPEAEMARIEYDIRSQLLLRKAYEAVTLHANVSPDEVAASYLQTNRTVAFAYASAPVADYFTGVALTDEEVRAYYDMNKELYRMPAQVSLEYVAISPRDIMASIEVTDQEAETYYSKNKNTFAKDEVNVEYIRFANTEFMTKVNVTPAEVNEYYTKNKEEYNKGSRVSVEMAALRVNDFTKTMTVTNDEKEQYYQANIEKYKRPETVKARHLLVRVLPEDTTSLKKEKRAKAEEALKEIRSGKDFIEILKKYSDAGSGENAGDLGYFKREDMVAPFSDAAFKLKPGEISGIVETQFGYHIIRCEDRKAEYFEALSEPAVATSVETNIKMEKARVLLAEKKVEIEKALLDQPNINQLAARFGMQFQRLPLMTQDEYKLNVIRNDEHVNDAFSSSNGMVLRPYADTDSIIVVQITGKEDKYYTPLEFVRGTITQRLKNEKADAMAKKYVEGFYEQLKTVSIDQFTVKAQELKLLPLQTGFFGSGYNDFIPGIGNDAAFRRTAFMLDWSKIPEPVKMQDGSYVIMRLVERRDNFEPDFMVVKSAVVDQLKMMKASKKTATVASKVKRSVSDAGFDEKLLQTYGLRVQKNQKFDEKNPPEFLSRLETPEQGEKIKKEMFTAKKNSVLKPIRSGDSYVIVRVVETAPSSIRSLDEVRTDVTTKLRRERALEAAKTSLAAMKHTPVAAMKVSETHPLFNADDIKRIAETKDMTTLDKGAMVYHIASIVVDNEVIKNMTEDEKKKLHDDILGKKQEHVFAKWLEKARKDAKVKNYIYKFINRQ